MPVELVGGNLSQDCSKMSCGPLTSVAIRPRLLLCLGLGRDVPGRGFRVLLQLVELDYQFRHDATNPQEYFAPFEIQYRCLGW